MKRKNPDRHGGYAPQSGGAYPPYAHVSMGNGTGDASNEDGVATSKWASPGPVDDLDGMTEEELDQVLAESEGQPAGTKSKRARKGRREVHYGVRYGGNRRKWLLLVSTAAITAATAPLALVVAITRPNSDSIEKQVNAKMATGGKNFPSGQAAMWAEQVVRVWGTWDQSNPEQREVLLSQYLSAGMDPQAGWNKQGTQRVIYSAVNPEPKVIGPNQAYISASYQLEDGNWRCVSLPVFAYHPPHATSDTPWAFALSASPTPTACSPRTGAPPAPDTGGSNTKKDAGAAKELQTSFLPGFFSGWAASNPATLRQYTASGVSVIGLGGAYQSPKIGEVQLPAPPNGSVQSGQDYIATVPVTWTLSGAASQITTSYEVPLHREGAQWFVTGEPVPSVQNGNMRASAPAPVPGVDANVSGQGAFDTPTMPPPAHP